MGRAWGPGAQPIPSVGERGVPRDEVFVAPREEGHARDHHATCFLSWKFQARKPEEKEGHDADEGKLIWERDAVVPSTGSSDHRRRVVTVLARLGFKMGKPFDPRLHEECLIARRRDWRRRRRTGREKNQKNLLPYGRDDDEPSELSSFVSDEEDRLDLTRRAPGLLAEKRREDDLAAVGPQLCGSRKNCMLWERW